MDRQKKQRLKDSFRKQAKQELQILSKKPNILWLDSKITRHLKTFLKKELSVYKNYPKNILLYLPLSTEYNTFKIISFLKQHYAKQKINIFVPFIEKQSFKVVKYRLPLFKKQFGIMEPGNSFINTKKIHLAFIPTLGIDKNIQRVGFGKGMYDRFFENFLSSYKSFFLKQRKIPKIIFISRILSVSKIPICESHDISGNMIFTPFTPLGQRKMNGIYNYRCNRSYIRSYRRISELPHRQKNFYGKL